jgi:signal transduction histidine kinase
MILNNLQRAAELIQSFKQVAVDQSSEARRVFPVKAYVEEVLLSLRPKLKRTQHSVELYGDEGLSLNSYPGVFSQIVTNLVLNSLIHAYGPDEQGRLTFTFKQENDRLIFEYADDGRGIPPENLSKIFDPFFTTKRGQGGSGLGLHIIYNLVTQKLGGVIRCESEGGQGTRFIIETPIL